MAVLLPMWYSGIVKSGRRAFVDWAAWGVQNNKKFRYTFERPLPLVSSETPAIDADCSWFVKLCAKWANLESDPTGTQWGQWGNSRNIYENPYNRVIPRWRITAGDLAVYGVNGDEHIVVIYRGGFQPLVISDGEQGDPSVHPLSLDTRTPRYFVRVPMHSARPTYPPKRHKGVAGEPTSPKV